MAIGIRRTHTNRNAIGNDNKILIGLTDGTEYKVNAAQLNGKTEEEINAALQLWISANRPDLTMPVGVHLNRDGSFCIWTGAPADVWPEDAPLIEP